MAGEQTLAQRVKAKYPGVYDALSDAELEKRVIAKYPGVYDALPRTTVNTDAPPPAQRSVAESIGAGLAGAAQELNPVTIAKGLYQTVAHPIETAKGVADAHMGQLRKAMENAKAGRYSEAYGHAMAALIPLIGPAAANIGEEIAETGDVAHGVGRTFGLVGGLEAPAVARGAVAAASKTGVAAKVADAAEQQASRRIVDVMAPKVGPNRARFGNMAADVSQRVAGEPGLNAFSRQGLGQKVAAKLADAESALDAAHDARNVGHVYPTKPIVDALEKKRRQLTAEAIEGSRPTREVAERTSSIVDERGQPVRVQEQRRNPIGNDVVPSPNASRVTQIDRAISEIKQLGPVARFDAIRRVRQAYDGPAKAVYSPAVTADYMAKMGDKLGAADVTSVLREHLGRFDPATAKANAEYALWRKANDVLEAAEEIERTRPTVGRKIAARFAGAVAGQATAGPAGAALGVLLGPIVDGALSSGVTSKVVAARQLTALAQALRSGSPGRVEAALAPLRGAIAVSKQSTAPTLAPAYAADTSEREQMAQR